jgi:hypothetical protein
MLALAASAAGLGCETTASGTSEPTEPENAEGIVISPDSATVMAGQAVQFVVVHTSRESPVPTCQPSYTATGGTITLAGKFVAGAIPGSFLVIAACTGAAADTASIRIRAEPAESLAFLGDFENGFTGWNTSEHCCSYSQGLVSDPVRAGRNALRIELRREDPQVALGPRSELIAFPGNIPTTERTPVGGVGDEVWWGLSIYVPTDWQYDTLPEIVHQVHEQPDIELGETWRPPPFALQVRGNAWEVWNRWDPEPLTGTTLTPDQQALLWSGPIAKGRWTDWIVHAKWAFDSAGVLEVWRDDTKVVEKRGPNAYNDRNSMYLKVGIYKWPWKAAPTPSDPAVRVVYYDEVRIAAGQGRYSAVAPR